MRGPWDFEEPLCAEVGIDFFFPDQDDNFIDAKYAKSICARCSHKTECLEWAIENSEVGIWGGTNYKTRTAIRAKRNKSA